VDFTALSTGCAAPRFEFWVQYPNKTWVMGQPFGIGTSFNWDTTGRDAGTYTIHVWANNAGDPTATFEVLASSTVTLTGCSAASVTPSFGSSSAGSSITFNVSSFGCPNPVYEFWLQGPDGKWHSKQAFSPTASWLWTTTGYAKGAYNIHVWANNQGANTGTYEVIGPATYTLT
jgi:hypothetical protein